MTRKTGRTREVGKEEVWERQKQVEWGVSRRMRYSGQKEKAEWETAELERCRVMKLSYPCPRQVTANRNWQVGGAEV